MTHTSAGSIRSYGTPDGVIAIWSPTRTRTLPALPTTRPMLTSRRPHAATAARARSSDAVMIGNPSGGHRFAGDTGPVLLSLTAAQEEKAQADVLRALLRPVPGGGRVGVRQATVLVRRFQQRLRRQ
jgi:hypothetical protein